jgi:hypothetical protein
MFEGGCFGLGLALCLCEGGWKGLSVVVMVAADCAIVNAELQL